MGDGLSAGSPLVGGEPAGERIDGLLAEWEQATCFSSSASDKFAHWAMQRIVGMAEAAPIAADGQNPVLEALLARVADRIHLHWALCYLTGESPPAVSEPVGGGFVATDLRAAAEWWSEVYAQRPDRRVVTAVAVSGG